MAEHEITRDAPTHRSWDETLAPVLEIDPGDVVSAETDDFAAGQITRDSTDLQYRRNEPEAYRLQARIGETEKYRAWLKHTDAGVVARACEMLMVMEDEAAADAPTLAKLALGNRSTTVGTVSPSRTRSFTCSRSSRSIDSSS